MSRVAICAVLAVAAVAQACLPPPYLYITFHSGSGSQQVGAWTRDGCPLSSPTDNGGGNVQQPRGMIVRTAGDGDGKLLLADAGKDAGRVMVFSACDASGARTYESDLVTEAAYAGLDHPYGIAISADAGTLYATNQDTNVVLAFDASTAQPRPAASYLNGTAQYTGEFAAFDPQSNGVRGVAIDAQGYVWLASEDDGGVYQFDPATGAPLQFVTLEDAVGVHFYNDTGLVYASSHSKKNPQVVAIDPARGTVVASYVANGEAHPAGIVGYANALYVVGQDTGSLFAFDVSSTAAASAFVDTHGSAKKQHTQPPTVRDATVVVQSLNGTGEQIVLSPC